MFTDYLDRGLQLGADGWPCVIQGETGRETSYRTLFDWTHRIAGALAGRHGIGAGSKVAVLAPNGPMTLAAVIGVIRTGAAWVALNPKGECEEQAALLRLLDCKSVLYADKFSERMEQLRAAVPGLQSLARFDQDGRDPAFVAWAGQAGETFPTLPYQADAPTMFMGSGGTTGAPKAIAITCRQLTAMSLAFNAQLREPAPPTYLMATPMTHAAGAVAFPTLAEGGTIIAHDGVVPHALLDSIERYGVSRIFLPPTAIYALLADPGVRSRNYGSLCHFIYAAAPMSTDKLLEALDVFGPVMAQTFGQSEAPMICTYLSPAEHVEALADPAKRARLASCGRASIVASVAIMDDEGTILGREKRGEIVVRGDLVMSGYHENPAATAEVRRPGGWHGTGDIGYIDADGYVFIVDRKRDLIISGGFNVYPSEVEQVIWGHDAVLDCAVIGLPDEKWGEAVTAVIELKPGGGVAAEEIVAYCKARLGSIRAPKSVIFRSLPRSSAGKVLKRALRDEYWRGADRQV